MIGLKISQCYALSNVSPSTGTRAIVQDRVMSDLHQYIDAVNKILRNNPLCSIKFQLCDNIEGIAKLTMDRLYLVKKIKSNVFRIGPIEDVSVKNTTSYQNFTTLSSSSNQPCTNIPGVKRTTSSKAYNEKKFEKAPFTPKTTPKITFNISQYQKFLPMSSMPTFKTVSVSLRPLDNSSIAIPQSGESPFTSSSIQLLHGELKLPQVVNIVSEIAPNLRSQTTYRDEVKLNENKSVIKELQEKEAKPIKKEQESSECKKFLQNLAGTFCRFCYQTKTPNQLCCKKVYYCGDECQKNDWERHHPLCLRKVVKQGKRHSLL